MKYAPVHGVEGVGDPSVGALTVLRSSPYDRPIFLAITFILPYIRFRTYPISRLLS